jgi:hypothetical protein
MLRPAIICRVTNMQGRTFKGVSCSVCSVPRVRPLLLCQHRLTGWRGTCAWPFTVLVPAHCYISHTQWRHACSTSVLPTSCQLLHPSQAHLAACCRSLSGLNPHPHLHLPLASPTSATTSPTSSTFPTGSTSLLLHHPHLLLLSAHLLSYLPLHHPRWHMPPRPHTPRPHLPRLGAPCHRPPRLWCTPLHLPHRLPAAHLHHASSILHHHLCTPHHPSQVPTSPSSSCPDGSSHHHRHHSQ